MNLHLKNLKLLSPSSNECLTTLSPTKTPMHINTDTQKALEHLRGLASNPSELELANQSFNEQLRTLPPFTPANLQQTIHDSITVENKLNNNDNHQK
ncbi:unnamed protein product, partial [Rotaria sp. Silwood2]